MLLEEGFRARAWHGPNLLQALRGVSAAIALWRPARGRHNIWELTLHCAYWKYMVRRRTLASIRLRFPLPGSNWFPRSAGNEKEWKAALRILAGEHRSLLEALPRAAAARRRRAALDHMWRGAAMHDVYHAGQILLLKKLASARRPSAPQRSGKA